jgi:hypothetical protein
LGLELGEITERAQGPEVVPDGVHGPFLHLPLFLGLGPVAGEGGNLEGPLPPIDPQAWHAAATASGWTTGRDP